MKMGEINCKSIEYSIVVPLDKFDLGAFRAGIGAEPHVPGENRVCNTKNPELADYHVHFGWHINKKGQSVEFEIAYVATPQRPDPAESEPFAENLMQWLGNYFKFEDVSSRVMANFIYGGDKRQTVFPLPIKTKVADSDWEGEISGVLLDLPSKPQGVKRLFITQAEDRLLLGIQSERRLRFSSFSIPEELQWEREVAQKIVR